MSRWLCQRTCQCDRELAQEALTIFTALRVARERAQGAAYLNRSVADAMIEPH